MRYFWCYLLLGLLLAHALRSDGPLMPRRLLLAGTAAWLVGTLWSVESAIYCWAVWLPAYFALATGDRLSDEGRSNRAGGIRAALRAAMIPGLSLGGATLALGGIYMVGLGHLPDPTGFIEYAVTFRRGFLTVLVDPAGPIWIFLFVFTLLGMGALCLARPATAAPGARLPVCGVGRALAVASYFISRPFGLTAALLSPIIVLPLAGTLAVLAKGNAKHPVARLLAAGAVPYSPWSRSPLTPTRGTWLAICRWIGAQSQRWTRGSRSPNPSFNSSLSPRAWLRMTGSHT